jgi:hypothetical protein
MADPATASAPELELLEDDAGVNIEALTVSLSAVVMHADHAAVVIFNHVSQFGVEGPSRLAPLPAELGKGRLAPLVVASDGASPRGCLSEVAGAVLELQGRTDGPWKRRRA